MHVIRHNDDIGIHYILYVVTMALLAFLTMTILSGCSSTFATKQSKLTQNLSVVSSADCSTNNSSDNSSQKNDAVSSSGEIVGNDTTEKIWNYCRAAGMSEAACAAILANGQAESGFNSNATDGTGLGDSKGIWQFTNGEKTAYEKWSNGDWSLEKQLDWMFGTEQKFQEMWIDYGKNQGLGKGTYYQGYCGVPSDIKWCSTTDEFKTVDDIATATFSWMACYERPSNVYCHYDNRLEFAKQWYEKYTGKSATAASTAQSEGKCGNSNDNDNTADVEAGEAAKVAQDTKTRIEWLYGSTDKVPTSDADNKQYLTTFTVKVRDKNGNDATMELTMHKKLKSEVISLFNDIYNNTNYRFDLSDCNSLRKWGTDGNDYKFKSEYQPMSNHDYGLALDINAKHNSGTGRADIGGTYNPESDSMSIGADSEIVKIFKKHGFYWGGDWTELKDYMHFAYTNH